MFVSLQFLLFHTLPDSCFQHIEWILFSYVILLYWLLIFMVKCRHCVSGNCLGTSLPVNGVRDSVSKNQKFPLALSALLEKRGSLHCRGLALYAVVYCKGQYQLVMRALLMSEWGVWFFLQYRQPAGAGKLRFHSRITKWSCFKSGQIPAIV